MIISLRFGVRTSGARDPGSNAFVLNVLIVEPNASDPSAAVGLHLDNTAAINSARKYIAHSVSVLYLQVPKGMEGGELELFETIEDGIEAGPDATVIPAEGDLILFRGDAFHRISSMSLAGDHGFEPDELGHWEEDEDEFEGAEEMVRGEDRLRISLVLEQYRIPDAAYGYTSVFELNESEDHRVYSKRAKAWLDFFNQVSLAVVAFIFSLGAFRAAQWALARRTRGAVAAVSR